jgi:DNA-binding transcriptional regulator YiaG
MNELRTAGTGFDETVACFNCGSADVNRTWERQTFQYGSGESAVGLTAEVLVNTCKSCGFQFAGPEADEARHEAVCRYLGVLTPREIAAIREQTSLSRLEFCERTRIGIASLKRWETGALVQNAANDELIYLMAFPENVVRLRDRDRSQPLELPAPLTESEEAPARRHSRIFRGRCISPNKLLIACSREWPLRVRA